MKRRSLFAGLVVAPALVATAVKAADLERETVSPRINLTIHGSGSINVDDLAEQIARGIADGRCDSMIRAIRHA